MYSRSNRNKPSDHCRHASTILFGCGLIYSVIVIVYVLTHDYLFNEIQQSIPKNTIVDSQNISDWNVNVEWINDEKCEWKFQQAQNEIFSPNATKQFFERINSQNWSVTLLGDSVSRRIGWTFKYHLDDNLDNFSDAVGSHRRYKHLFDFTTEWTPNSDDVIDYLPKNETIKLIKENHIFIIGVGTHRIAFNNETREQWMDALDKLFSFLTDIQQKTNKVVFIIRTVTVFQHHYHVSMWNELLMQYAKQHNILFFNAHQFITNDEFDFSKTKDFNWMNRQKNRKELVVSARHPCCPPDDLYQTIHHQSLCRYILLQQHINAIKHAILTA